jgi:hypothetical protein
MAYALFVADIPPDHDVQRTCSYSGCVAPAHLKAQLPSGSSYANPSAKKRHLARIERGEARRNAKLTEAHVRAIRAAWARHSPGKDDGVSCVGLAATYGVTDGTISHITRRRTWRHVA